MRERSARFGASESESAASFIRSTTIIRRRKGELWKPLMLLRQSSGTMARYSQPSADTATSQAVGNSPEANRGGRDARSGAYARDSRGACRANRRGLALHDRGIRLPRLPSEHAMLSMPCGRRRSDVARTRLRTLAGCLDHRRGGMASCRRLHHRENQIRTIPLLIATALRMPLHQHAGMRASIAMASACVVTKSTNRASCSANTCEGM